MSDNNGRGATNQTLRLVALIVAGLVITNIVAATLFERDTALGIDELLVAVVGVVSHFSSSLACSDAVADDMPTYARVRANP